MCVILQFAWPKETSQPNQQIEEVDQSSWGKNKTAAQVRVVLISFYWQKFKVVVSR